MEIKFRVVGKITFIFQKTPFRVSLMEKVLKLEEQNVIWPLQMKALNKDTIKWCAFHKDIDHDTKDCQHLKNKSGNCYQKATSAI